MIFLTQSSCHKNLVKQVPLALFAHEETDCLFSWLAQGSRMTKWQRLGSNSRIPRQLSLGYFAWPSLSCLPFWHCAVISKFISPIQSQCCSNNDGLSATWELRTGPVRRTRSIASPGVPKRAWAMVSFSWGAWHWQLVSSANGAGAVRV